MSSMQPRGAASAQRITPCTRRPAARKNTSSGPPYRRRALALDSPFPTGIGRLETARPLEQVPAEIGTVGQFGSLWLAPLHDQRDFFNQHFSGLAYQGRVR